MTIFVINFLDLPLSILDIILSIVQELQKIAVAKFCSLSQLALSWVASQSDRFLPLFGTTKIDHVQENCKSTQILLSPSEIKVINDIVENRQVQGRSPSAMD